MVDKLSAAERSRLMSKIRSKNTKPEMMVRRLLFQLGFRYRLHQKDLPGKPDIVFNKKRKVVLVHGCFWHSHPGCKVAHVPPGSYWREKLVKTQLRDKKNHELLVASGWKVLIVWECELKLLSGLEDKLKHFLID